MAKVELSHAIILHSSAADLVTREKANVSEEISEYMEDYYEESHKYYINEYDILSYLINKFSV